MKKLYASRITGTGSAFPQKKMTNQDLVEKLAKKNLETSDEWIQERTGISERRVATPEKEEDFNSSLAFEASKKALEMAKKTPADIDQIIVATCTPDTLIPSSACWLQAKLEAKNAFAMDLNAACSGFVFGLASADQAIRSGDVRTSLVVGADVLTAFTNWEDRGSCILFGDGAGAAIVERTETDSASQILSSHLHSDGSLWELFYILAGGSRHEVTPERFKANEHKMRMKGREVFKHATRTLADFALKALKQNDVSPDKLDWLIPHQANRRIIESVIKRLGFPLEKTIMNIERFGNTSSATVPTALDEAVRDGRIKPGHLVLLDTFGAGLTYGSILLRW